MDNISDVVGLIGVGFVLLAYVLLQTRRINPFGWAYSSFNALGSALIIYSLLIEWNLSAFVMEFSWLLVSLYGLYLYFKRFFFLVAEENENELSVLDEVALITEAE